MKDKILKMLHLKALAKELENEIKQEMRAKGLESVDLDDGKRYARIVQQRRKVDVEALLKDHPDLKANQLGKVTVSVTAFEKLGFDDKYIKVSEVEQWKVK